MYIPTRENCKYHTLKSLYDDTTMECEECIESHYLFTFKPSEYPQTAYEDPIKEIKICKQRLLLLDDCIEYYIDKDSCKVRDVEEGTTITEG